MPWQIKSTFIIISIHLHKSKKWRFYKGFRTFGFSFNFYKSLQIFATTPSSGVVNGVVILRYYHYICCSYSSQISVFFSFGVMAELNNFCHLLRSVCVACVGVNIQCNACIRVSHQILKVFNVHTAVCVIRAESVTEYMGSNVWQWLIRMKLLVLLHCPTHFIFNVECDLGITVLIQHNKPGMSIHHRLIFDLWAVF